MMRLVFYISCFLVPLFAFILARMLVVVAGALMGNINSFLPPSLSIFAPRPTGQLAVVADATSGTANFNLHLLRLPCRSCPNFQIFLPSPLPCNTGWNAIQLLSYIRLCSVSLFCPPLNMFSLQAARKKTLCTALSASGIQHWVLAADDSMPSRRRSG
jgi:hypothetical protein